jgi:N-acetylneuraminic acid mutarotase
LLSKALVEKGFDVNRRNKYGFTPLHFAALNGMDDIVSLFVKKGAPIDPIDKAGKTPLDYARQQKKESTTALLLSLGAREGVDKNKSKLDDVLSPEITWSTGSAFPFFIRNMGAAVGGRKIYVVGGYGSGVALSGANFEYDILENAWITKAELSFPRSNLAVVSLKKKIYALGGNTKEKITEVYDPVSDMWHPLAPLPTPRTHLNGSAAALEDKIYVLGGVEKWFVVSDKNEVYDTASSSWEERAPMPTPRQSAAVAAAEGKIYAIGGNGDYPPHMLRMTIVEAYNPRTDTWERKADIPESGFPVGAVVVNGKILVLIQTGWGKNEASKIYSYDPKKDVWSTAVDVPRTVRLAGFTAVDSMIFIIGGVNSREVFSDILIGKIRN